MKTYTTTIEIDEVEVKIEVDYELEFSRATIICVTNLETKESYSGNEFCALIPKHTEDALFEELFDWGQNEEQISLENHYENV